MAEVDEPGLVVAVVGQRMHTRFEGYSDSSATKKKILTDVFVPGDIYFNSGDLLYRDWFGFFYWSDRVGDTFRYKGKYGAKMAHMKPTNVLVAAWQRSIVLHCISFYFDERRV